MGWLIAVVVIVAVCDEPFPPFILLALAYILFG